MAKRSCRNGKSRLRRIARQRTSTCQPSRRSSLQFSVRTFAICLLSASSRLPVSSRTSRTWLRNQCSSQYIGTLLVKVLIKHEHIHLSSRHGIRKNAQSEFSPRFDLLIPQEDLVRTREVDCVMTLDAFRISDGWPE